MRRFAFIVCVLWLCATARAGDVVETWLDGNLASLVELYKHLHAHPELSLREQETSARMAEELSRLDAEVQTKMGGYGVLAILKNGEGPRLMLRADMDALPVAERTELVYASAVKVTDAEHTDVGVMHACGHDIHMTNLIGTLRYLDCHRDRWRGTVMAVFQPAEERGQGALAMLEAGLFKRCGKPDYALALHCDSKLPTGTIACRAGYALANVDSVDITVHGRGGHGAAPHTAIDPIVQAAHLVLDLQTIVSREVKPTEPAVITVGAIHGGSKHNIIGDTCKLQLTLRSYSDDVRKQLLAAIERKAKACASSAGAAEPDITISEGTPAMFNDAQLVERLLPVFRGALGAANVTEAEQSMGGEDFSQYGLAGAPICMFNVGTVHPDRLAGYARFGPPPSLHSPLFYPDPEETLTTGIRAMVAAAEALLPTEDAKASDH